MVEEFDPASSNLQHVEYDGADQTLTIEFTNGGKYEYRNVPRSVFYGLRTAPSPGQYFYRMIRNQFSYDRIG